MKTIVLLVLAASLVALTSPASAQLKRPQVTGNLIADIKANNAGTEENVTAIWTKVISAASTDLAYASAMAASAGTPGSKTRQQCWDALLVANKQASGASLVNADGTPMVRPDPHMISDVESIAETIDNLSPQGTLYTSCAGAAQLAKRSVLQLINSMITGVAAFTATGGLVP